MRLIIGLVGFIGMIIFYFIDKPILFIISMLFTFGSLADENILSDFDWWNY